MEVPTDLLSIEAEGWLTTMSDSHRGWKVSGLLASYRLVDFGERSQRGGIFSNHKITSRQESRFVHLWQIM